MVPRPELKGDDITGKGVDAVWREVVCGIADFDQVHGDFALLRRLSGGVYGSCGTIDVLTRYDARKSGETEGRYPSGPNIRHPGCLHLILCNRFEETR